MYGIAEGNAMHSSDPAVHEQRLQPSSGKNTPNHIGAKQKKSVRKRLNQERRTRKKNAAVSNLKI